MARRGRPRPGGGPPRRRKPRNRYNNNRANAPAEPRIPDTPAARLEDETRAEIARLVKDQKAGHGLLESDRLLARVLEQHPEHAGVCDDAASWKVQGDLDSPFVHLALHKIVEQRVVSRDTSLDMTKLATGLDWHDAVHKANEIVAAELFGVELTESVS